jgi:hypothetical protein
LANGIQQREGVVGRMVSEAEPSLWFFQAPELVTNSHLTQSADDSPLLQKSHHRQQRNKLDEKATIVISIAIAAIVQISIDLKYLIILIFCALSYLGSKVKKPLKPCYQSNKTI